MLKRLILVSVATILIALPAAAQTAGIDVTPASQTIALGGIATVTVGLHDVSMVHGYSFAVMYNPSLLRCTKATRRPFLQGTTFFSATIDSVNGKVKVDEAILGPFGQSGSGAVAEIVFTPKSEGTASLTLSGVQVRDTANQNVAVTQQNGSIEVTGGTSSVGNGGTLPDEFSLVQNFPNPFNPTTSIMFDMPVASRVRLEVFQANGRSVAVLVDGTLGAGRHVLSWNAQDDTGLPLASGVYLCRMTAGDVRRVIRMSLVR